MQQQESCPDCGGTKFVEDRSAGDTVCSNCGLVVEAHMIDERSEWRTFSDKDKEGADPNRVGGPTNPLLDGGGLSTTIGKSRDGDNSYVLNRLHTRSNNPDRALISAFKKMGEICEMMQLSSTVVKDGACENYKMAAESGRLKGRGVMPICAACLYVSCRQNNVPRSFKEITAVLPAEVTKKDISRCFQEIMRLLKEKVSSKPNASANMAQIAPLMRHPADYMTRFSAELRLDFNTRKTCQTMALSAKPKDESQALQLLPWDSRSPLSVAAAILYMGMCIKAKPQELVSMQDIVMVTNVAQVTIRAVYRELYSHLTMLLPPGVSFEEAAAKLPVPEGCTRASNKSAAESSKPVLSASATPPPPSIAMMHQQHQEMVSGLMLPPPSVAMHHHQQQQRQQQGASSSAMPPPPPVAMSVQQQRQLQQHQHVGVSNGAMMPPPQMTAAQMQQRQLQ